MELTKKDVIEGLYKTWKDMFLDLYFTEIICVSCVYEFNVSSKAG